MTTLLQARAQMQMQLEMWPVSLPAPVASFEEATVRASTLSGRISRAVATTLRDCDVPREEIARRMGEILGEEIRPSSLDAWASQAREGHRIPACRLTALAQVTGDRRLLQLLAEPMGWVVIEGRYLPMITLAAIQAQEDQLRALKRAATRAARSAGGL